MAEAPKGTARRDRMLKLEEKAQAKWDKLNAFEVDAPEGKWDGGKFFATFPYPYMNGMLHLGHGFSLTKAEFACAYQRLQGKKVLFPFSFHCTGMPIQAAAVKLKKEYDLYGCPVPNFPPSPPEVVEMDAEAGSITIGWRLPTSTGGKELVATKVLVRKGGAEAAFAEVATLPAEAGPGGQCSYTATGLEVGANYSFKIVTEVAGLAGVESKPLEKSADGKHALALLAPKKDDGKKAGGKDGKKGAKSKVAAKTGTAMTQWDILRAMGLEIDDLPPFTDPTHWLRYFPPIGKVDLKRFGCGIDWRRTFVTTDYNKYYDQFVRWQFLKLKEAGVVAFGKRPSIFSEADKQPCMDHDRDKGEGVGNQEYVALKLEVLKPFPAWAKPLEGLGKTVYCLAGTLRPETMAGQTNCWVLPEGEYGAYDAGDKGIYVCAARAARNMGFQDLLPSWGSPKQLCTAKGKDMIGTALKAPQTSYATIYMLPLTTISMVKGTAIVTSVPSDSPDDYAAFMDLKNPKKREFYGVKAEWVDPFEPIEIIETPDLGRLSAKFMCEKLKVQSQKDVEKLKEAHDIVYNSGFYKGIMTVGPFKGEKVEAAKPKMKAKMIADGEAFTYFEPDGIATPRSSPDVECVVALVDQWYLKYGDDAWRTKVVAHLETTLECYNPAVHKAFSDALGWLGNWACSRSFGLGTRMPWDEQFLIESLSDSTIYMAFYTVSHLLQGGEMFGQQTGPSGVTPEQCTPAFFDYIFFDKTKFDPKGGVPQPTMDKLRREFQFWYPMDMRVSGKDLIPNHLTMSLYNHAAVWGEQPERWPRSIFCNGHVQVDAEKMSKSKGNFITMQGAMQTWGADATRFTCADAGDGVENANYDRVIADRTILNLTTELEWIGETLGGKAKDTKLRAAGAPDVWFDGWFANEMAKLVRETGDKFKAMRFKDALKLGFFGMQEARNRYRTGTAQVGVKADLVRQWAEWQAIVMAPITPHWSEELWEMLGKPGCVVNAKWPTIPKLDAAMSAAGEYLFKTQNSLSSAVANRDKKKPKGGAAEAAEKPNQINLYVAHAFPRWKEIVIEMLRAKYDEATGEVDSKVLKEIADNEELKAFNKGKQVPQFAAMMRDEAKASTSGKEALSLTMPFDEAHVLRANASFLCAAVPGIKAVHVWTGGNTDLPEPDLLASAAPGKPQPSFFFDATIKPSPPTAPPPAAAASALTPIEYVEKHNLAPLLNTAINEVSRVQPADPVAWLSEWLAKQKK